VRYKVIVNTAYTQLTSIFADVVIANNIVSTCSNNFVLRQKYSVNFLTDANITPLSGNPGYLKGSPLLIGRNNTIGDFEVPKYGVYTAGADNQGLCLVRDGSLKANTIDQPILFGEDLLYSCSIKMTYDYMFFNYCPNKLWNQLVITQFPVDIQYIGQFGNSNYKTIQVI